MNPLLHNKTELRRRWPVLLACLTITLLSIVPSRADWLWGTVIGPMVGTIASVIMGAIEVVINFLVWCVCMIVGLFIDLGIQAMAFDWSTVTQFLGDYGLLSPTSIDAARAGSSSRVTSIIIIIAYAIYGVLLMAEIAKIPMAAIMGEERVARPGTIAARGIMYGAGIFIAIPFARTILQQAGKVYTKLFSAYLTGTDMTSVILNKFNMMGTAIADATLVTQLRDILKGDGSGPLEVIIRVASTIITFLILLIVLWNFAKLVLECAQRIGQLVLLVYLSPVAIGCGVSPSMAGVPAQWLKTFVSTLLLWIMDILVLAASASIVSFDVTTVGTGLNDRVKWLIWAFFAFAFIKASQQLDDMFNALGANVLRSSGSLLGDFMAMSQIPKALSNAAQTTLRAGQAIARPGKAMVAAASARPGMVRTGGEIAKDVAKAGFNATKTGRFVAGAVAAGGAAVAAFKNLRSEPALAQSAQEQANNFKSLLHQRDSLPKRDPARKEINNELAKKATDAIGNPAVHRMLEDNVMLNGKSMKELGFKTDSNNVHQSAGKLSATFKRTDPTTGKTESISIGNIRTLDQAAGTLHGTVNGGYKATGSIQDNKRASYTKIDKDGNERKFTVNESGSMPGGSHKYTVNEVNGAGQVISSAVYKGSSADTTALDVAQGLADGTYSGLRTTQVQKTDNNGNTTTVTEPERKEVDRANFFPAGANYGETIVNEAESMKGIYENADELTRVSVSNVSGHFEADIATGSVSNQNYAFVQTANGYMGIMPTDGFQGTNDIAATSSLFGHQSPEGEHKLKTMTFTIEDKTYEGAYEARSGSYKGQEGMFVTTATANGSFIDFIPRGTESDSNSAWNHAHHAIAGRSDGTRIFASSVGGPDGLFQACIAMDQGLKDATFGAKQPFESVKDERFASLAALFKKKE